MCAQIYTDVYLYVYMNTYIYTYIHICKYMYTYIRTYTCIHTCTYIHIQAYTSRYLLRQRRSLCIFVQAHICTEMHTSLSSPPPADGHQRIIYMYTNRRIHLVVCTAGKWTPTLCHHRWAQRGLRRTQSSHKLAAPRHHDPTFPRQGHPSLCCAAKLLSRPTFGYVCGGWAHVEVVCDGIATRWSWDRWQTRGAALASP